jgi:serine phosphatase RsbU (regulator of sigma subunit)
VEVQIGVAKVSKYAMRESGDTLEVIERPHGGLSAVLVDGQSSGRGAKLISNIVARKAISLLGEGVRDGAAARASHDYLTTHRGGRVSAELQIVSVDLISNTLVISRNTQCPVLVARHAQLEILDTPSQAIGIYPNTKPVIAELPLEPDLYVVAFSDGASSAGRRQGRVVDLGATVRQTLQTPVSAQALADAVLHSALQADAYRPEDDISVLVVAVLRAIIPYGVRRLSVSFPLLEE